jgi:hypothetical protein
VNVVQFPEGFRISLGSFDQPLLIRFM